MVKPGVGSVGWQRAYLLACSLVFFTLGSVRGLTDALRSRGLLTVAVALAFGLLALPAGRAGLAQARRFNAWGRCALGLGAAGAVALYALVASRAHTLEERLHLVEYGGLALLLSRAYPTDRWPWRVPRVPALMVCVGATGWVDELIQGVLPNRHHDLRDVAFNAVAGALVLGLQMALQRLAENPRLSRQRLPGA